jgi:hypothetical protein
LQPVSSIFIRFPYHAGFMEHRRGNPNTAPLSFKIRFISAGEAPPASLSMMCNSSSQTEEDRERIPCDPVRMWETRALGYRVKPGSVCKR